jgi:hypothetical protein
MLTRIGSRLTYANVVATLALFVALGGSAMAAHELIDGKDIEKGSEPGNRLKPKTVTGKQVKTATLGRVPNALNLGGKPASSYRLRCPAGLRRAADVCFEPTRRPQQLWEGALKTCARAQLRLPSAPELALVFDHGAGLQEREWTSTAYEANSGGADRASLATSLAQSSSRDLIAGIQERTNFSMEFQCVTSPSN